MVCSEMHAVICIGLVLLILIFTADAQSVPTVWKLGDFLFLKLVGNLFPVTDFQHAITTSATILMAQVILSFGFVLY
jgi:hypothetical protein